jgi:type II secretory pathway pseudopilin PulG
MRFARGFSLLELAIVVVAVLIVTAAILDRVLPLIGRAQRAAFLGVQHDLQTSLRLAAAERIAGGKSSAVFELESLNPMSLLLAPPANYRGVVASPDQAAVPPATWYFDEEMKLLAYRVGRYTRFKPHGGPADRIELRVAFTYDDRDADGVFDASQDRFDGLRLEPVHGYDWPD